jgi:hypothetical protein
LAAYQEKAIKTANPSYCGKGAAPRYPPPLQFSAARAIAENESKTDGDYDKENRPAHDLRDESSCTLQLARGERCITRNRNEDENDCRYGKS